MHGSIWTHPGAAKLCSLSRQCPIQASRYSQAGEPDLAGCELSPNPEDHQVELSVKMHQLIDSLPPPIFNRLGGQPYLGAPDRSNRKRNKAVTVFCLLSIFTSPPVTPFSLTPFHISIISSTFSPKICPPICQTLMRPHLD